MSTAVLHRSPINLGDLTPYLTYGVKACGFDSHPMVMQKLNLLTCNSHTRQYFLSSATLNPILY
jgi:hypothetical protein